MVLGRSKGKYQKWKFKVLIDGIPAAESDFQKAGPLEGEVAVVEYNPGGAMVPEKQPGRASFPPVTLEKGVSDSDALYEWFKEIVNAAANEGGVDDSFKRMVTIQQLKRNNEIVKTWRLHDAWPSKFVGGDWDGSADEFTMESVELQYQYPELV